MSREWPPPDPHAPFPPLNPLASYRFERAVTLVDGDSIDLTPLRQMPDRAYLTIRRVNGTEEVVLIERIRPNEGNA